MVHKTCSRKLIQSKTPLLACKCAENAACFYSGSVAVSSDMYVSAQSYKTCALHK